MAATNTIQPEISNHASLDWQENNQNLGSILESLTSEFTTGTILKTQRKQILPGMMAWQKKLEHIHFPSLKVTADSKQGETKPKTTPTTGE